MKAVPVAVIAVAAMLVMAAMVLVAAMAPGAWSPGSAPAALPSGQTTARDAAGTPGDLVHRADGGADAPALAALPAPTAPLHTGPALAPADKPALALTEDHHLIADQALRAVMEAYLSDRRNPRRLQQLDEHLRERLPAGAASEAHTLAARYDAYLAAHATLLKAQNFADEPDLQRLTSWQAQRRQLRERMLGPEVTEQWFGTEDAYLEQALEERRQPVRAVTGAEQLRARHLRAVVDAATGRLQR